MTPFVNLITIIAPPCFLLFFPKEGNDDNVIDGSSSKMSRDIYAPPPSFHKLCRGGTTQHDRHFHHSENSSTSHLIYGDIRGGDESLNGVKGALSSSMFSPQYPVPTGVGESAHNWNVGRAHLSVPSGDETGMFGIIPLLDSTHTNTNFNSANSRGHGKTETRRGDSTRTPGIRSSTGRLSGGVNRESQASRSSLARGKEPALHSHGGLTMATFLKLVRR